MEKLATMRMTMMMMKKEQKDFDDAKNAGHNCFLFN